MRHTLTTLAADLASGATTSRALVEQCLAAIADPAGEGGRTFLKVDAARARALTDAADGERRDGRAPTPFAGIPFSYKDLFDAEGEVTTAGSVVLADAAPAANDCPAVSRMLGAGFIPMGRTNMTEFAFSGLGINPHYGTPAAPWDRQTGRVPGDSSSGAAVSIADGMAFAALGTDTGGSCRIPAALCGIVGYKPTARRVPTAGVVPLSTTLDSIGPLANSVACCAIIDAVLSGHTPSAPAPRSLVGVTLALPDIIVTDDLDDSTAAAFDRACVRLSAAGARIERVSFAALAGIGRATAAASLSACEAFAWHRQHLAASASRYDRRVRMRIEGGAGASAADYIDAMAARRAIITAMDAATGQYDALIMPTAPIAPPRIAALEADDVAYNRANALMLRNPALTNFLDRCSISIPCHRPGDAPAGLMLVGETMGDAALFALAGAVEAALA